MGLLEVFLTSIAKSTGNDGDSRSLTLTNFSTPSGTSLWANAWILILGLCESLAKAASETPVDFVMNELIPRSVIAKRIVMAQNNVRCNISGFLLKLVS